MIEQKSIMKTNRLVIFEGVDRSGKTSLREALRKDIPNLISIDRLTPSNYVYAAYFNRPEDISYLVYLEMVLSTRGIIVYCYCEYDEYLKRCKETNHEILTEEQFIGQQKLYEYYFKNLTMFKNIIQFDTGRMSVNSCLEILKKYINSIHIG